MKTITFILLLLVVFAGGGRLLEGNASAQSLTLTNYDSVVSLATNVTKNYTFTDPSNGLSVVVAVTMTPYSRSNASPVFTLLDFSVDDGNPTHMGIDSGLNSGDGNWVDFFEGVNFTASLVSVSNGVITNSIQFGIVGMGIRQGGATTIWTSPSITNTFTPADEALAAFDAGTTYLDGTVYSGQLRTSLNNGQYQISDKDSLAGQSIVFAASFVEGTGAPVITLNPTNISTCDEDVVSFVSSGASDLATIVQWQVETNGDSSFVDIPNATNATLTFTATLSDSGNSYQAVFVNSSDSATTTVATLTVYSLFSAPVLTLSSPDVLAESTSNTASGPDGAATYSWSISNGTIVSETNAQAVTYTAGVYGNVTLTLTIGNVSGCTASSTTNIVVDGLPGVTGGAGIYVSDDSNYLEKFDADGAGSMFAYTENSPSGIAFDSAGNLYEANYYSGTILKFATNGTGSLFASGLVNPYSLAFDGAGNLYVANDGDNTLWKFTTNGVGSIFNSSNVNSPSGMAVDRAGNIYVANYYDNDIVKFTTDGNASVFATNIPSTYGMAFDSAGNLFVVDADDGYIFKCDTNGASTLFATNDMNYPVGLAFDSAGNLYVANDGNATIAIFTTAGDGSLFATNGLTGPESIAFWPIPPQLANSTSTTPSVATAAYLSSLTLTNNQFSFTVTGTAGTNYTVQAATDLGAANWVSISTNASPFLFVDENAGDFTNRYYRALVGP